MTNTETFRCPFEEQGQRERTIVDVQLGEGKNDRLAAMTGGFFQFFGREAMAVRFVLPPSILVACSDFQALKKALIPYQAELHAALLDYRLRPLLAYDVNNPEAQVFMSRAREDNKKLAAASVLLAKIQELGVRPPKSIVEQAMWIETHFRLWMQRGFKTPAEEMSLTLGEQVLKVLRMDPSAIVFFLDREHSKNRKTNLNCFSVVKCPLYPREFGRFSEQVEIVMNREADYFALPEHLREQLRVRSNTVLKAHGIRIRSLKEDIQELGLWVPEFETSKVPD